MTTRDLEGLLEDMRGIRAAQSVGSVVHVGAGLVHVAGLQGAAQVGDQVLIFARSGHRCGGEVLRLSQSETILLSDAQLDGIAIGDEVLLRGPLKIAPSEAWVGRVLDANAEPMDGLFLTRGPKSRAVHAAPPNPATRRSFGPRLETGMAIFNTLLPIVQAQRIGLFAGSGVGKSSLLAHFAAHMQADIVVIALIGERGREVREYVEKTLGPDGMARTIVVAATSDQSPLVRKRCALSAMSIAEYFRDMGRQVLLLADSITRFAEAHRDVAIASGEAPSLRGFPPSTSHAITSLCERAGPGSEGCGDITALFTVLVAGSDMEEPIADIMRGVLDGHVVMDRAIAERGRYPAIDAVRSVSRSLPGAANDHENNLITTARRLYGSYDESALMIRSGLYSAGSDATLDKAIAAYPQLDRFVAMPERINAGNSFQRLELILRKAGALDIPGQALA